MLRQQSAKKVVIDTLNKPTLSNPNKTYAEAMIDKTITKNDLVAINTTMAFPANNYNRFNLPDGAYSSMEAMQDFVALIMPYLSDAALYHVTHTLVEIEVDGAANTQAFRTSTLAKYFMIEEAKRHSQASNTLYPDVFLSHMHDYVLPLCEKNWGNPENTISTFVEFNLGVTSNGVVKIIKNFKGMNAATLDTEAPRNSVSQNEFLGELKNIKEQDQATLNSNVATNSSHANTSDQLTLADDAWTEDVLKKLKTAKKNNEQTNCISFEYIVRPEQMDQYNQLQQSIAKLIPEEYNRPTIILHILGRNRSIREQPDIGMLGGMGPLSDAKITSDMFRNEKGECEKDDNAYLLLVSAPAVRDEEPKPQKQKHKSFRTQRVFDLGNQNCKKYAMLSNTAHVHRQSFRFATGDYLGIINKVSGTTKFINLVREISEEIGSKLKKNDSVLVLGTTEAAVNDLYPGELRKLGVAVGYQFGSEAPPIDRLPQSQIDLQNWINKVKTSESDAAKIRDEFLNALIEWIVNSKAKLVVLGCTEIPLFLSYPYPPHGTNGEYLEKKLREKCGNKTPELVDTELKMIAILNAKRQKTPSDVYQFKQEVEALLNQVKKADQSEFKQDQLKFMQGLVSLINHPEIDRNKLISDIESLKAQYPNYNAVKTLLAGTQRSDSQYSKRVASLFGTVNSQMGMKINNLVSHIEKAVQHGINAKNMK